MRKALGTAEVLIAALCLIAISLFKASGWNGGWIGFSAMLVFAGWFVAGHNSPLKRFLKVDLKSVWPWYFGILLLFSLSYITGNGPQGFGLSWSYLASFTYNLPRLAQNWSYSDSFSCLWIFSSMMQVALFTVVFKTTFNKKPFSILVALISVMAIARSILFYRLSLLRDEDYFLGDCIFWFAPFHLDAAFLGYAARRYGHRLPRWSAFLILPLAGAGLYLFTQTQSFPLASSYAPIWAYPVLSVLIGMIFISVARLISKPLDTRGYFAGIFLAYIFQDTLRGHLVGASFLSFGIDSVPGIIVLSLLSMMLGTVIGKLAFAKREEKARAYVGITLVLGAIWSIAYIVRTSFIIDSDRVFVLWDDAMISMTYAKNFAAGHGFVWYKDAAPLQGFSNLGMTLLMSLVHAIPFDPLKRSLLIQLVCALAGLICVWVTARTAALIAPNQRFAPALAALSLLLFAPFSIWGLQGSDTAFTCLFSMLLIHEITRGFALGRSKLRLSYLLVFTVIGIICRMDMFIYAGLAVLFLIYFREFKKGLWLGLGSAFVVGCILGFNRLYFGDWLPNTYYLKAAQNMINGKIVFLMNYAVDSFSQLAPLLALAGYGLYVMPRAMKLRAAPALLFSITAIAYNYSLGGDWMLQYESRFLMPAYPPLFVLGVIGLLLLASNILKRESTPIRSAFVLLILGFTLFNVAPSRVGSLEWLIWSEPTMYRDQNRTNVVRGLFFNKNTAHDTSIGLHWAGTPGYFADRPLLDFLGKCDRHIAHTSGKIYWPGHSKWDWDYVMNEAPPDIISEASRGLEKREDFLAQYQVRNIDGVEFFVRKGQENKILK